MRNLLARGDLLRVATRLPATAPSLGARAIAQRGSAEAGYAAKALQEARKRRLLRNRQISKPGGTGKNASGSGVSPAPRGLAVFEARLTERLAAVGEVMLEAHVRRMQQFGGGGHIIPGLALTGGISAADAVTSAVTAKKGRRLAAAKEGAAKGALYGGVLAASEPIIAGGLRRVAALKKSSLSALLFDRARNSDGEYAPEDEDDYSPEVLAAAYPKKPLRAGMLRGIEASTPEARVA